jgi:hypothetical protein
LAAAALATSAQAWAAAPDAESVRALEVQLNAAQARVAELEAMLSSLASDVQQLKASSSAAPADPGHEGGDLREALRAQILAPDLGDDERDKELDARPELFVQTGYAAAPIDGAEPDDAVTRFTLNRMESRWSGRVTERLGLGFELQYNPAPVGAAEELVNDAFVEYYASEAVTVRAGQFVKPFGFDVQQSSSKRESPERAMFAGYFFPGQRDRGVMVRADLSRVAGWLDGVTLQGALLNGNRFFNDDNDALNVNLRVRKSFSQRPFAIALSYQDGSQLKPPGAVGSDRSELYGVDAQWLLGRLGIRAEWVRGDMPSTLLSLEPEFAPGFAPGEKTWSATAFFDYRLTQAADVYWRWDRLDNDPVTNANVRAFNVGYLHRLGEHSRLAVDYQWKDDVTFNDDQLNTQLTLRLSLTY